MFDVSGRTHNFSIYETKDELTVDDEKCAIDQEMWQHADNGGDGADAMKHTLQPFVVVGHF